MRTVTHKIYDDTVIGTTARHTADELNAALGNSDFVALQAYVTNVAGTGPTLTIQAETSIDGQLWTPVSGTPEVSASPPVDDTSYVAQTGVGIQYGGLLRYKISMGGTNPECRLLMFATLRVVPTQSGRGRRSDA